MVRAASRIATNAEKIRSLAKGSSEDRAQQPSTDRGSRPVSRQDHHAAQREGRVPTDILSDGYDSSGDAAGSEQVLALLRSGVSARQSMDLTSASSEYKRASSLQSGRKGKKLNKYTVWLRGLAARYSKDTLRSAALDIQRCYRGMLGREDD